MFRHIFATSLKLAALEHSAHIWKWSTETVASNAHCWWMMEKLPSHRKSFVILWTWVHFVSVPFSLIVNTKSFLTKITIRFQLGRYLVFYFQAWQNVLHNELAAKGYHMFRFNTYLSSALIIFYLQMERNLPKIDDLRVNSGTSTSLATADGDQLHQITYHLFHLYGHRYQIWNHIISAQVGRWQQQYMQSHEKPKKSPLPQYR